MKMGAPVGPRGGARKGRNGMEGRGRECEAMDLNDFVMHASDNQRQGACSQKSTRRYNAVPDPLDKITLSQSRSPPSPPTQSPSSSSPPKILFSSRPRLLSALSVPPPRYPTSSALPALTSLPARSPALSALRGVAAVPALAALPALAGAHDAPVQAPACERPCSDAEQKGGWRRRGGALLRSSPKERGAGPGWRPVRNTRGSNSPGPQPLEH